MEDAGLPLDAAPRQGQTVTRAGDVIPIHGGIDPAGNFNVITPVWNAKKGGYTEVEHGSSFVQAVHLKPGCPDVRTILTYGESTNPESPHYADQTKLFSRKGWVAVPFCPQQLERDRSAVRTHTADAGSTVVTVREARGRARPRIEVARPSGRAAHVTIRVRRASRVVRRIARRGSDVAVSPRVARGSYRVDVTVGTRTIRVPAKQR
jgi:acyl-homoserine-lactone acylase